MIESLYVQNNFYESFVVKKVNNIYFFLLNYKEKNYNNINKVLKYKKYFINTYVIFYFRIIWRGKAFRVRFFKKSNKFTFNFGYSHWTKLIYDNDNFNFVKLGRQNYIIIFKYRLQINYVINAFNTLRTMNKYTKRGIRIKQTPYIRRFGKISQVNSSLHSFG